VAYKRKGIIARPGIHRRLDGTEEVITAEELKESVLFQNRIPLVLKHPKEGTIDPSDRFGTALARWNDEKQVLEAEYWFFEEPEYWNKIPKDLQQMILDHTREIKTLSAGYKVPKKWEGAYKPRQWDHIAIDEKNPMQDIGIEGSVRMESNFPDDFRIESETPEISGEKKEGTLPAKTTPYDPVSLGITIGKMQAQIDSLTEQLARKSEVKQEPAAPERTEDIQEPVEREEATTPDPPKARTTIPKGAAKRDDAPDEDGVFRITVGQEK